MAADKFLSLSKLNKKYFNPVIQDKRLTVLDRYTYYATQTSSISILKNKFNIFVHDFQHQIHRAYSNSRMSYDEESVLLQEITNIQSTLFPDALSHELNNYSKKCYIYPFSFSDFKKTYYANCIPSESNFILQHMIANNKIINFETFLIIADSPFTKEQYSIMHEQWKNTISLDRILDDLKSIQNIVSEHRKDLKYLTHINDQLSEQNKNLMEINRNLSDNLHRASQINWS